MTAAPPTEERGRALLEDVAERLCDRAILWRGADLGGSDIDLLVTEDGEGDLARLLAESGLRPEPGDPGHVVWSADSVPDIDVLAASAWPRHYPSLQGLLARLSPTELGPPEASPEDRALILAAEAVAGRPLEKVVRRARAAVEGAGDRLKAVAAAEGLAPLAELVSRPEELMALERRGRLPYRRAVALALRSPAARAALAARVAGRVAHLPRRPRGKGSPDKPLLITLSGMDGAGKSTAAEVIRRHLESTGLPAEIAWARLGSEGELLYRLATPVKRLLRRRGTVADPVAAGGPTVQKLQDPSESSGRRRFVSWVWIVIVAWANARSYRSAARGRRRGVNMVCDRWATDALVDLELRYGRHRLGRELLRRLPPRTDLSILLEIDAATAAARKPGDQAEWVLGEMERRYSEIAGDAKLTRVEARLAPEEVERRLAALVDAVVDERRQASG